MDDLTEELVIDVRATTQGFSNDLASLKSSIDNSLVGSLDRAGSSIEKSLTMALRKGTLGFDDLRQVAFQALNDIAQHALNAGIGSLFGGKFDSSGLGNLLGQAFGNLVGLPGRATGGPVSPGAGYIVGERGPELFVPTSAGRIEPDLAMSARGRDVRVAIQLAAPKGMSAPTAMRRSSRQIASAVRSALQNS